MDIKYTIKIKEWDLFERIEQNEEEIETVHFLARADSKGNIYLIDTPCTKKNTVVLKMKIHYPIHLVEKLKLSFIGNLNDFKEVTKRDLNYYNKKDTFIFNSCIKSSCAFYIKKGAMRNRKAILKVIKENIEHTKNTLQYFELKKEEIKNTDDANLTFFRL